MSRDAAIDGAGKIHLFLEDHRFYEPPVITEWIEGSPWTGRALGEWTAPKFVVQPSGRVRIVLADTTTTGRVLVQTEK